MQETEADSTRSCRPRDGAADSSATPAGLSCPALGRPGCRTSHSPARLRKLGTSSFRSIFWLGRVGAAVSPIGEGVGRRVAQHVGLCRHRWRGTVRPEWKVDQDGIQAFHRNPGKLQSIVVAQALALDDASQHPREASDGGPPRLGHLPGPFGGEKKGPLQPNANAAEALWHYRWCA